MPHQTLLPLSLLTLAEQSARALTAILPLVDPATVSSDDLLELERSLQAAHQRIHDFNQRLFAGHGADNPQLTNT